MWWIIAIIFILITICILKDTHIKVYYEKEYYDELQKEYYDELQKEYDLELPIWALLLMILVYSIPIINIIAFISFLVYYIVHAAWNPENCVGVTHIFSLNGKNWITKSLLAIKKILNKKI